MHFEEPHRSPETLRDFLRQYAMIVLSILTAIGLEQLFVTWHNAQAANRSRDRIEREVAGNLADLRRCVDANTGVIDDNKKSLTVLIDALRDGRKTAIEPGDKSAFSHFSICLNTWQRSAWDVAIADQTASNLPAPDLRRYNDIYASELDERTAQQLLLGGDWITRASELSLDLQIGRGDRRELALMQSHFILIIGQITNMQKQLLAEAHGSKPGTAP